ncbi:MAG TPA: hypothetical protein VIU64_11200 [Polyangia bacterium]
MRLLVLAVMMVSGGLAVVARCFEATGDSFWAVPSLVFGAGVLMASAGTFLFVRSIAQRPRAGLERGAGTPYGINPWSGYAASNDAMPMPGDGSRAREDVVGMPFTRAEVREAARMLIFAGEEELERLARARTAGRSACRRAHARRAIAPQPKRRRVRNRPRLMM